MQSSVFGSRYTISAAARLLGLHVNTLRKYERQGLILPARSRGNQRVFTKIDLARLEQIKRLVEERGVNLAGVDIVLDLTDQIIALRQALRDRADVGPRDLAGAMDGMLTALLAAPASGPGQLTPLEETYERIRASEQLLRP